MTLIEIMVAIVIVALVSTGVTYGMGLLMRTSLRSACMKILAASRFAYGRSVAQGATVRVVLDLDQGSLAIEEAHGPVALARTTDPTRVAMARGDDEDAPPADDGASVDPWAAAQAALSRTQQPSFGASPFAPIANDEGETIERYTAHPLGRSIRIVRLTVPHEPEPRDRGRAAIYFFPGGRTEHALVQVSDGRDGIYTVELHPLTGRGRVHTRAYEPRELEDDRSERSEVDE